MKTNVKTNGLIRVALLTCALGSLLLAGCVSVASGNKPVDCIPRHCKFEGGPIELKELGNNLPIQNIASATRNAFAEINAEHGRVISVSIVPEQGESSGYRVFVTYQLPAAEK